MSELANRRTAVSVEYGHECFVAEFDVWAGGHPRNDRGLRAESLRPLRNHRSRRPYAEYIAIKIIAIT